MSLQHTRRGFLRLLGIGTVAAPAVPMIASKVAQPVSRIAEPVARTAPQTVQRAELEMIVSEARPLVRVGQAVRVEWLKGGIGRIEGVVEEVSARAGYERKAQAVIRIQDVAGRTVTDVTNATRALRTWSQELLELVAR